MSQLRMLRRTVEIEDRAEWDDAARIDVGVSETVIALDTVEVNSRVDARLLVKIVEAACNLWTTDCAIAACT